MKNSVINSTPVTPKNSGLRCMDGGLRLRNAALIEKPGKCHRKPLGTRVIFTFSLQIAGADQKRMHLRGRVLPRGYFFERAEKIHDLFFRFEFSSIEKHFCRKRNV